MLPSQHHLGRIQYKKRTCCALAILLPTVWNSPRGAFDTSGWPGLAACALRARAAVSTAIDAYMVSKGRYGSRLNEKTKGYLVWGLAAKGEGAGDADEGGGEKLPRRPSFMCRHFAFGRVAPAFDGSRRQVRSGNCQAARSRTGDS